MLHFSVRPSPAAGPQERVRPCQCVYMQMIRDVIVFAGFVRARAGKKDLLISSPEEKKAAFALSVAGFFRLSSLRTEVIENCSRAKPK